MLFICTHFLRHLPDPPLYTRVVNFILVSFLVLVLVLVLVIFPIPWDGKPLYRVSAIPWPGRDTKL